MPEASPEQSSAATVERAALEPSPAAPTERVDAQSPALMAEPGIALEQALAATAESEIFPEQVPVAATESGISPEPPPAVTTDPVDVEQAPGAPAEPRALLEALVKKAPALELGSIDILFLAALYLRAERTAAASFGESDLIEVFREVVAIAGGSLDTARKRATHAIGRLREQRLLVRVDGSGVVRSGEYALTRLGTAIVQFFLEEEALTRESLSLLTQSLIATLRDVLAAARRATDPAQLRDAVVGPLRVTVADLAEGIARRQRALDVQQEDFQRSLASLLQADWFGALERCDGLLEETSRTLRELNEILLRDTHRLHEVLQPLREIARDAPCPEAEHAVERVSEQVDRIAEWGAARQRAWSEYHQSVHRFLRDIVRLDPTRALTERLRAQLGAKEGRSFALTVAAEPPIVLLRDVAVEIERPPVRRAKKPREKEPEAEEVADPEEALLGLVRAALDGGASSLAEVTDRVTRQLPEDERYVAAGRVAEMVARLARAEPRYERPWVPVADAFLVEEWPVLKKRDDP